MEFYINQPIDECDLWVVYQGLFRPESCRVSPGRTVFIGYEPPSLHKYEVGFLGQFSQVILCHSPCSHPGLVRRHQAQPWLAGIERHSTKNIHTGRSVRFTWDDFQLMELPVKDMFLSVLCSRKRLIPGHQARLQFLAMIQEALPERLDVFGYGFRPLTDKWDALSRYHYHLVLENSCIDHYWTEKLADAYLGWCVPIVWGCPNLADYFPSDSFVLLDPNDPVKAVQQVCATVARPPSEGQMHAVAEARRRILEEYNLFAELRRLAELPVKELPQKLRLKDEGLFRPGAWVRPLTRRLTDWWRFPERAS